MNWEGLKGTCGLLEVSQSLPGRTEKPQEPQPGSPVCRLWLEPETSWIQSRSVNYDTALYGSLLRKSVVHMQTCFPSTW